MFQENLEDMISDLMKALSGKKAGAQVVVVPKSEEQ
jgi:hypothetical protein